MTPDVPDSPLSIAPPPGDQPRHTFEHRAMACTWGLCILGEPAAYAGQVAHAAFAEVDRVEQELSRFIEHSDVARINALPAGQSLRVGIDALACLELAAQLEADTHGAFDVTVASRLDADGTSGPPGRPRLEVQRGTHSVTAHADGLVVDLGGIGKGYALDQVIAILRDWSVAAALVHSGQSTVYGLGSPAGESGWTVALRDPRDPATVLGRLRVRDTTLSGSGAALHGQHIIDPRTRRPATGALAAWALAPSAAAADALSTAFMVLAPDEVADYCRQHPDVCAWQHVSSAAGQVLLRHGREVDWLTADSQE